MKKTTFSLIAAFLASTFFGIDYVVLKLLMPKYITPDALVFIRSIIATVFFWIVAIFVGLKRVSIKDLLAIAGIGVFGIAFRQYIYFLGLNLTSPIDASIIIVTVPILVLIISHFLLKERITKIKTIGMILGLIGAIAIITAGHHVTKAAGQLKGNLMVACAAILQAFYYTLIKSKIDKYGSFTVTAYLFLFGSIVLVPLTADSFSGIDWKGFTTETWLLVGYVCFIVTILAYFLNVVSLKNLKPSVTTSFSYLGPIVATICSYFFLHIKINVLEMVSAALIFIGGYLILRDIKRTDKSETDHSKTDSLTPTSNSDQTVSAEK